MAKTENTKPRKLSYLYPEHLEKGLRRLSAESGIPLHKLKAVADRLTKAPSVANVWQTYREDLDDLVKVGTSSLTATESVNPNGAGRPRADEGVG